MQDLKKLRDQSLNEIITSSAKYKIIVAGAGTGKSYTMLKILESNQNKEYLVLTLTNELINELHKDLGQHANCQTFHKFCLDIFNKKIGGTEILYPGLEDIIDYDSKALGLGSKLVSSIINCEDSNSNNVKAYLKRSSYYNALCFNALVYKVLCYLKKNKSTIKKYELVLIDEFQDFNKVENELVNLIEEVNSMIIVGDDDQAIYKFRGASPEFIRQKNKSNKYMKFSLPYCSRCTLVIIDSVKAIIKKAYTESIFNDRIKKDYISYSPDKNDDSLNFPKIIQKNFSVQTMKQNYMANYIKYHWNTISSSETDLSENKIKILIIGPRQYLNEIYFKLIEAIDKKLITYNKREREKLKILFGLKKIDEKIHSNLGWRIIAEEKLTKSKLKSTIKEASTNNIEDFIDDELKNNCKKVIQILNISSSCDEEQKYVLDFLNMDNFELVLKKWSTNKFYDQEHDKKTPIKLTTFEGSKGLAADYVFIVGLEEKVLPKNSNITDDDVCKFIVALTRAKKQCHILTCVRFAGKKTEPSRFLGWIPRGNLDIEYIDKSSIKKYE